MTTHQHHISPAGLDLIKQYEACKLTAYLCPANIVTIGYGHVLLPKYDAVCFRGFSEGMLSRLIADCEKRRRITKEATQVLYITQVQADALLNGDVRQTVNFLNSVTQVELSQNQFDALCSLIFNVGQGNYAGSTLKKLLNTGDFNGAAAQFERWVSATVSGKKQKLPGLITRRAAERALFETL